MKIHIFRWPAIEQNVKVYYHSEGHIISPSYFHVITSYFTLLVLHLIFLFINLFLNFYMLKPQFCPTFLS